jgi:hypothetical protein
VKVNLFAWGDKAKAYVRRGGSAKAYEVQQEGRGQKGEFLRTYTLWTAPNINDKHKLTLRITAKRSVWLLAVWAYRIIR